MLINRFLWLMKMVSLWGTVAALIVVWGSDLAMLLGQGTILGIPVFDVKDGRKLALLLFPGAVVLILLFLVERRWGLGQSKREAVRQYARRLPMPLARRYGRRRWYTPEQIMCTVRAERLCPVYVDYAVALFTEPNEQRRGTIPKMDTIRCPILREDVLRLLGAQERQWFAAEWKDQKLGVLYGDSASLGDGDGGNGGDGGDG